MQKLVLDLLILVSHVNYAHLKSKGVNWFERSHLQLTFWRGDKLLAHLKDVIHVFVIHHHTSLWPTQIDVTIVLAFTFENIEGMLKFIDCIHNIIDSEPIQWLRDAIINSFWSLFIQFFCFRLLIGLDVGLIRIPNMVSKVNVLC